MITQIFSICNYLVSAQPRYQNNLIRAEFHLVVLLCVLPIQICINDWCLNYKLDNISTYSNNKVCQWLATGQWFSPCTPVSSTNKTDRHDITEIFLKVVLNTSTLNLAQQ